VPQEQEALVAFRLTDPARSWLLAYGLTEEQVQHVERTEDTWRSLARRPRVKSRAALLREEARRVEKLERKMRRA
jgi:hypothetical protein